MNSSTNNFNNDRNLPQTNLNDAYKFQTFSQYLNSAKPEALTNYSPICIFCSSSDTYSLTQDGGSFRQCKSCRKQFKAAYINKPCYK